MSGITSKESKAVALAHVQALILGLLKHLAGQSFTIGTVPFTTATLAQLLQELADAFAQLNEARAAAKDALAKLEATKARVGPVMQGFARIVVAMFTGDTATLADFGLRARKVPPPKTVEQMAAAKAKAKATREARGTMSAKAKRAIKGNVTGVTVTPITSPAAAEPSTQPAAIAPDAPHGASK
jgi:hypothetical protein